MKPLLLTITLFTAAFTSMAQSPVLKWQRTLGGTGSDYGYAMQQTNDGGYLVAGAVNSTDGLVTGNHGSTDMWVVKLNDTGGVLWQKAFGGTSADAAFALQTTADGGAIVVGSSMSNDGDATVNNGGQDVWVVKLGSNGNLQWQRSYGGFGSDVGKSVQQTFDGGYVIAGQTASNEMDVSGHHGSGTNWDYWVLKINSTGVIQWQKCLGGSNDDIATCIRQTKDTGFVVCGSSRSSDGDITAPHDSSDFWIVKLTPTGNIQWQKSLGGTNADQANTIIQTADGGYLTAGSSASTDGDISSNHGTLDCWIAKLSATGTIQWQKSFGGSAYDEAQSVIQGTDGDYVVASYANSIDGDITGPHGGSDCWIYKVSSAGSLIWQKSLGGSASDQASCLRQSADGNYIVVGTTYSSNGDITGKLGPGSTGDIWTVKLSNPTVGTNSINVVAGISLIPNPAHDVLTVVGVDHAEISIFNISGKRIAYSTNASAISIADLPAGLYLVNIFNEYGELLKQEKIIKTN